ncbi:MAG: hypothetical protein V4722_18565 [Bacteroidota bacterium]
MKNRLTTFLACIIYAGTIVAQSTDLLPFTGAMVKGTGIRYKEVEIRLDGQIMLSADLPRKEEMTVKITDPWSLVMDVKGDVYPGAGYRILDMKRKVLVEQKNIFRKDQPGIPRDYLKSLSVSITITDDIKSLDSVILQARFFDTKDNDSVLIEIPCKLVPKGKGNVTNGWGSFSGTNIAKGAYSGLEPGKVKGIRLKKKADDPAGADTAYFTIEKLDGLKTKEGKVYFNSVYTLYDAQFKVLEQRSNIINGSDKGVDSSAQNNIQLWYVIPNELTRGFARIVITDRNSPAKLDAILPLNKY